MKFGAQLFSINNKCQSAEDIRATLKKMKEIGYDSVQLSGFHYDAEATRAAADEVGIHIGLTHTPIPDIINNTDEVIRKHLITGADTVGVGFPAGYIEDGKIRYEDLVRDLSPAVEKIQAAGLNFAYHNHHYEFFDLGGFTVMDYLYENTNWNFILDAGWVYYTGTDVPATIRRFADRLKYVHLKDFRVPLETAETDWGIVSLYEGGIDWDEIIRTLIEVGTTEIAYIEQDTASKRPDPYGEMEKSFRQLVAHGWVK